MRRMSFSATVEQMRDGSKTVTRRDPKTWQALRPGELVLAVEKAMGLRTGEKQTPIGVIRVLSNEVVTLADFDGAEARREGFTSSADFFAVWRAMHGPWNLSDQVRRIEFEHVEKIGSES